MQKPKILVVDDEDNVRKNLSAFILKKFNSDVGQAKDGKEALEKIKEQNFDLMLLDIKMPGISGIEVIKQAKISSPQTKILVVSGYDSNEVAKEALKAGAMDFVPKPYTAEAVAAKVKSLLTT